MKYLLVLLVVGVGLWLWSARFRAGSKGPKDPAGSQSAARWGGGSAAPGSSRKAPAGQSPTGEPRQIVACGHCGVHLPADEAVYADQVPYCGAAHLQAGRPR